MPDGSAVRATGAPKRRGSSHRVAGRKVRSTAGPVDGGSLERGLAPVPLDAQDAERDTALAHLAPWARDAAIIATIAQARNRALSAAGYSHKVYLPSAETVHGMVSLAARKARLGDAPVYFTPKDHCMVFVVQTKPGENGERRPARILIADQPAIDKRGRIRRWATSSAALAEARRIERDAMGIPRRKRVGAKAEPAPPGALLELMGG